MAQSKQKVLILGFFLPIDQPAARKTPLVYQKHARADQELTTGRLDELFVAWDGQQLHVADPTGRIALDQFDALHIVDWSINPELSYAVTHYLKSKQIPTTNQSVLLNIPDTKVGEMIKLTDSGITYPRSFYAGKSFMIPALYQWAHDTFAINFPVIVKGTTAAQGEDNFMVQSYDELVALPLRKDIRYIMQEYIPNQADYRVLIIDGRVTAVIKRSRTSDDTHLNNVSQGARASLIAAQDVPEVVELARKAAQSMHRSAHAGVDILVDAKTNVPYVLEVNKRPDMAGGKPEIITQKLSGLYDYIATLR